MQGVNIVSHIPATIASEQYVVLGAHYDSVSGSPGANDNATGVAAVLSIASDLAALETRNVHFLTVLFDQEEDDSPGSKAFAKRLINEGLQIHSMHNIDMIGWDGDRDRTVELDVPTQELEHYMLLLPRNGDWRLRTLGTIQLIISHFVIWGLMPFACQRRRRLVVNPLV